MANERLIPSIDNKLIRWAEYINQDEGQSIGSNILAKAMASGGSMIRSTNPEIGNLPDDVYDLDKQIKSLDSDLSKVVHEHYLHADCPLSQRYINCGCASKTYYRRLSKAHSTLLFLSKGPAVDSVLAKRQRRKRVGRELLQVLSK